MDTSALAANARSDYVTEERLERRLDPGGIFGLGSGSKRPVDALRSTDQPQYLLFSGGWKSHFKVQSVGGIESAGPAALVLTDTHAIFVSENEDFRIRYTDVTEVNALHKSETERKIILRADGRTYRFLVVYDCMGTKLTSNTLRRAIEYLHQQIVP